MFDSRFKRGFTKINEMTFSSSCSVICGAGEHK